jgi:hypothetical protein
LGAANGPRRARSAPSTGSVPGLAVCLCGCRWMRMLWHEAHSAASAEAKTRANATPNKVRAIAEGLLCVSGCAKRTRGALGLRHAADAYDSAN